MRCAIYTRKSSAEGLDAEHSSLENQRGYCADHIRAMAGEGWQEISTAYDDGGFSGGSLRRPGLAALRADIAAGKVDVVVVYKIDRLTRSLRDFMTLLAEFEARGVVFVSVTQAFSTANAMGKLTLNILLSFAEFEREMTGERLREWFASARAKGLWARRRPYGYDVVDRRLVVKADEAKVIREAHAVYARLRSSRLVAEHLNAVGTRTIEGRPWNAHSVGRLLRRRLYTGAMVHRGAAVDAPRHKAIVTETAFEATQRLMAASGKARGARPRPSGMLGGLLFAADGTRMVHVAVRRRGKLYRYYVPGGRRYGPGSSPAERPRAAELEATVLSAISLAAGLSSAAVEPHGSQRVVQLYVETITFRPDTLEIKTRGGGQIIIPIGKEAR